MACGVSALIVQKQIIRSLRRPNRLAVDKRGGHLGPINSRRPLRGDQMTRTSTLGKLDDRRALSEPRLIAFDGSECCLHLLEQHDQPLDDRIIYVH